ncbi:MAG: radical SAM family heme chaperone HemW [Saccharofermentanales bacterium]
MKKAAASVYIHIPFCRSKCFYCDFNSYSGHENLMEDYFDALLTEIDLFADHLAETGEFIPVSLQTLFFGGGTPTYVPSSLILQVIDKLAARFGFDPACEITIECNPGTVDSAKIRDYKAGGINRISIGLQSASDRLLALAGRTHSAADFDRTINQFLKMGFKNVSVDLIEGLPDQKTSDLLDSLTFAADYDLKHLSLYSLSIEQGTPFYDRYHINDDLLPDGKTEREMYHMAIEFLKDRGLAQYEISNFAKPGFQCRHNVSCWKGDPYFGFGAGAHSYFNHNRYSNVNDIEDYIKRIGAVRDSNIRPISDSIAVDKEINISGRSAGSPAMEDCICLDPEDAQNEYFLLGFRLTEGISEREFKLKFGQGFEKYRPRLISLKNQNLIFIEDDRYRLTDYGLDFANKVFIEFV